MTINFPQVGESITIIIKITTDLDHNSSCEIEPMTFLDLTDHKIKTVKKIENRFSNTDNEQLFENGNELEININRNIPDKFFIRKENNE